MSEIRADIRDYLLCGVLDGGDPIHLTDDLNLREAGILDSLVLLELVDFLEGRFQVTVGVDEAGPDNFTDINHLVRYVTAKTTTASEPLT